MTKLKMLGMAASLTALLAGCSSGGAGKAASPENTAAPVKQDPVELVFYYPFPQDWDQEKFMKTFGEPIQNKYPWITVKYITSGKGTSIPELITAGQKIDVLGASIGATPDMLMGNDLQFDITPLIKKYNFDLKTIDPATIDTQKTLANGALYGLPIYVPPSTIYYNKDIFDKFGVPFPKDGMTWDDIYELNKKLTRNDGDVQYFGFGSSYAHTIIMNQLGIPLVDSNAKKSTYYSDDRWKPYLLNFIRMYQLPGYENLKSMSEGGERNQFFKDRTMAMFSAITALESPTRLEGLNWDWTTYPVFKDKPDQGPSPYPIYFYITGQSDHKDAAFQAVSYLTSDDFQTNSAKQGAFVPISSNPAVMKSFGQDNPVYKGKNVTALRPKKYAVPGSVNKYNAGASWNLDGNLKKVIQNQMDMNEALRQAAEVTDKTIQDTEAAKK